MNIFYVDKDPVVAARSLVDKHVVKMILESAQLLSTAHRLLDGEQRISQRLVPGTLETPKYRKHTSWVLPDSRDYVMYSATHANHPSAVWCRKSVENYNWLADHLHALLGEYTYRYEKKHKVEGDLSYMLMSPPKNLEEYDMTVMPSAMADEYKISDDPIINYRNYYKVGKERMHAWKKRQPPEWINE
jgi:hypothetical protein